MPKWMDGVAFTVAQGRDAGLSDGRMRASAFTRPFHGVRVIGSSGRIDGGLIDRCHDLRTVLPDGAVFSHATAARLWAMPLPLGISECLHVMVPRAAPVRRAGVIGWTRSEPLAETRDRYGVTVPTPADTWVMLATMTDRRGDAVTRDWLVAIGDFLVSGARTRYGRGRPLATLDELAAAVRSHRSGRGAAALAWALPRVRVPVDSPPESLLRLGRVAAGLPEPVVQPTIATAAGPRHPDLGYVEARVLIEYLGDVHRVDRATWRQDLVRVQLFQDAGFHVILAGADDLAPAGLDPFALRVCRALQR